MMKKKSFFERLTGGIRLAEDDEMDGVEEQQPKKPTMAGINPAPQQNKHQEESSKERSGWIEEEEEGQLTVDVYQTPTEIIVQTMVAGVQPENLSITITRDMITIRGKREETRTVNEDNYFVKELYWGAFSRTISLPQEVEPEEAEAIEKHGLLIIKLPKINKDKKTTLKVKSF